MGFSRGFNGIGFRQNANIKRSVVCFAFGQALLSSAFLFSPILKPNPYISFTGRGTDHAWGGNIMHEPGLVVELVTIFLD